MDVNEENKKTHNNDCSKEEIPMKFIPPPKITSNYRCIPTQESNDCDRNAIPAHTESGRVLKVTTEE